MSQDQIQLPEPDGYVWHEGRMAPSGGYEAGFGFSLSKHEAVECAVFPQEIAPVFFDDTVRRLIAAAVAAERAKNIAALEALNLWDYDDPASSAIAAIQGDQT